MNKYHDKKNEKDLRELFDYLSSRGFENFPKIISYENNTLRTEFINETKINDEDKQKDFINVISNLHYKTSYYKDVSKNKYKKIYERLLDNIEYIKKYYDAFIEKLETEIYPSPAHYFILRNYSIIDGMIKFCSYELENWFNLVKEKNKERVSIVHNNLKQNHYIRGDKGYLISFDKYLVDTPILDLYKLYTKEAMKIDFNSFFEEYLSIMKLSKEEIKLFCILISLPKKIEELDDELLNIRNIKYIFEYYYKTSNLVKRINLDVVEDK